MGCRNRVATSVVNFCSGTHCGLILTIFLIQLVGQTSPKAQYPAPGGQIPPYDVQYPDPGVDTARGGYQGEGNDGSRRLDSPVSRISGQDLRSLLQRIDVMLSNQCTRNVAAQWQFETDVNPGTQQAAVSLCACSLGYVVTCLVTRVQYVFIMHLLTCCYIHFITYSIIYLYIYLFSLFCIHSPLYFCIY
jgi:hypothetical protein